MLEEALVYTQGGSRIDQAIQDVFVIVILE